MAVYGLLLLRGGSAWCSVSPIVSLYREEQRFFRFILGSCCFSLLIFALTTAHLAYEGVFLCAGALVIVFAVVKREKPAVRLPDYPTLWKAVYWGALAVPSAFTILFMP